MQSSLINAAKLISEHERPETDITEALPSGVVTVRDFQEAVRVLQVQGVVAVD